MSTSVTPEVQPQEQQKQNTSKQPKIPTLSPWLAPNLICPNKGCFKLLRPKVSTEFKGGEPELQYDCVDCGYSFFSSLVHAQGIAKPIGKGPSGVPEVFQKGK